MFKHKKLKAKHIHKIMIRVNRVFVNSICPVFSKFKQFFNVLISHCNCHCTLSNSVGDSYARTCSSNANCRKRSVETGCNLDHHFYYSTKSVHVTLPPSPLEYPLYAQENDDNYGRPLNRLLPKKLNRT